MINLKPARRQAYRYGKQFGELIEAEMNDEADAVQAAYGAFLRQFDALDGGSVTKDWLREEYGRGLLDMPPLTINASRADLSMSAISWEAIRRGEAPLELEL